MFRIRNLRRFFSFCVAVISWSCLKSNKMAPLPPFFSRFEWKGASGVTGTKASKAKVTRKVQFQKGREWQLVFCFSLFADIFGTEKSASNSGRYQKIDELSVRTTNITACAEDLHLI
jgi:hypothetical protein